jgi:hypothetical protein
MMRAVALERGHGIHHMFDHARTGNLPVLGDMANENNTGTTGLGIANERLSRAAHLRDSARR